MPFTTLNVYEFIFYLNGFLQLICNLNLRSERMMSFDRTNCSETMGGASHQHPPGHLISGTVTMPIVPSIGFLSTHRIANKMFAGKPPKNNIYPMTHRFAGDFLLSFTIRATMLKQNIFSTEFISYNFKTCHFTLRGSIVVIYFYEISNKGGGRYEIKHVRNSLMLLRRGGGWISTRGGMRRHYGTRTDPRSSASLRR